MSRAQAAFNIGWGVLKYAVAIAITPTPPAAAGHIDVAFFAIVSGTLITAGVLLSYLRQRVDKLMGRLVEASHTDPLTGLPNRVALHQALARELERATPGTAPGQRDRDRHGRLQGLQRAVTASPSLTMRSRRSET